MVLPWFSEDSFSTWRREPESKKHGSSAEMWSKDQSSKWLKQPDRVIERRKPCKRGSPEVCVGDSKGPECTWTGWVYPQLSIEWPLRDWEQNRSDRQWTGLGTLGVPTQAQWTDLKGSFSMSTWLGHGESRHSVNHFFGCVVMVFPELMFESTDFSLMWVGFIQLAEGLNRIKRLILPR